MLDWHAGQVVYGVGTVVDTVDGVTQAMCGELSVVDWGLGQPDGYDGIAKQVDGEQVLVDGCHYVAGGLVGGVRLGRTEEVDYVLALYVELDID